MNKFSNALYEIERELYYDCGIGMDGYNKENELRIIKELVNKETSPIELTNLRADPEDSSLWGNCECGHNINYSKHAKPNYCSNCGHKIEINE